MKKGISIFKSDILKSVSITSISKEFGIETEEIYSGNFDYRCTCPSIDHKNGGERTKSCYINSKDNNFYCFGCQVGLNCIDFYMLCAEVDFKTAMSILRLRAKSCGGSNTELVIEIDPFPVFLEMATTLRYSMLNHKHDLKWINEIMMECDIAIANCSKCDGKTALKIANGVKLKLLERYGE